ncbi:MAG TPA: hypothetical protein VKD90_00775 [Gemmataceae bacterium]|nr:hypothetical protein [Gemmataceae bacterium]
MGAPDPSIHAPPVVEASAGDFPLRVCRLDVGGHEWSVLSTGAVMTAADEARYFADLAGRRPYGVILWPAAIALAHEIANRPAAFRARTVLERVRQVDGGQVRRTAAGRGVRVGAAPRRSGFSLTSGARCQAKA